MSYGFWAIPKIGGQVLCGFIEGDPYTRFWMGCIYVPEYNRTMPTNIDPLLTEIDDSGRYPQKTIDYQKNNLEAAGLDPKSKHYKTRGGYERSISHPSNQNKNKPSDNGYYPKPLDPSVSDSQTMCLTSPGRHFIVMSDVDEHCRIRVKTTEGQQIILDDTNERIYVSTAMGRNWIEMDETNGKIYIYSDSKINIRSKNDINFYSDNNINIVAKNRVNIRSEERAIQIEAKHDVRLLSTDADIMATASRDIHLKTLNGPKAPKEAEETKCMSPVPNLIHKFAEKGGSDTSMVRIDTIDAVEIQVSNGPLEATAKKEFNIKSLEEKINIQGKTDVNIVSDEGHFDVKAKRDVNLVSTSDSLSLQSNQDLNVKTTGNLQLQSNQDLNIKTTGKLQLQSTSGDVNILADSQKINIEAKSDKTSIKGVDVHIKGGDGSPSSDGNPCGPSLAFISEFTETGLTEITIDPPPPPPPTPSDGLFTGSVYIEGQFVNLYGAGTSIEDPCCADAGGPIRHNGLRYVDVPSDPTSPDPAAEAAAAQKASEAKVALYAKSVELVKVVDKMVRPDHESWERDEDEATCKTKRNKKYQG
jgi:uncharacterized protein (DUF2345 family)